MTEEEGVSASEEGINWPRDLLLGALGLAALAWVISDKWGGGEAEASTPSLPILEIGITGAQNKYGSGCSVHFEAYNPGSEFIDVAFIHFSAYDTTGKEIGRGNASSSDIRSSGFSLEDTYFSNANCLEIDRIRASSSQVTLKLSPKSIMPIEL